MFAQILTGSVMIAVSIVIMAAGIALAIRGLTIAGNWIVTGHPFAKLTAALTAVTLWLLAAISIIVWLWAALFYWLALFDSLEPALYFSIVAITTLGFGDVILQHPWRLLSGFIAANGLVLFGLNTAFLIEAVIQLSKAQTSSQLDKYR